MINYTDKELHEFGWAPGLYSFKCSDEWHKGDQTTIISRPEGAKRSSRCKECAIKRKADHEANLQFLRNEQLND